MENEGKVQKKKPVWKRWWFWLIVLVVAAGIGAASSGNSGSSDKPAASVSAGDEQSKESKPEESKQEEALEVTAQELLDAYDKNGVSADKQYKGKKLRVTGTVGSIANDILDKSYVTLENEEDEYALISVQCYFEEDQLDSIASLEEGDTVVLEGICEGSTINVMLKKCELVS